MGDTPHGIIPELYFTPGRTPEVMAFLGKLYLPSETKAKIFRLWAVEVGVKISASQVRRVHDTGVDAGGPTQ